MTAVAASPLRRRALRLRDGGRAVIEGLDCVRRPFVAPWAHDGKSTIASHPSFYA